MSGCVVYTAIFGKWDNLQQQTLPTGWDWKHFNEENQLPIYKDNNRNAKKFKILPHRYLDDYEYSIWIDGNINIIGNIDELVNKYLNDCNVALFNHASNELDPNDCIYKEANYIFELGNKNMKLSPERGIKNFKDNPTLIRDQIEKYKLLKYPANNGLSTNMIILRRHNEKDCIETMEDWWTEIKYHSKRDQLSFNYVAWKNGLKFNYIDGDSRRNEYFVNTGPHTGKN